MIDQANETIRVMLVDDEPLILETIGVFLEDEGFDVTTAGGGAEALELLEQSQVDVIITDLSMPKFDGFDLMNAVSILCPETPVIVLTGMGTLDNAIQAIKHGAYDFVTKPVEDMYLFLVPIMRAVEKRRILMAQAQYLEQIERRNQALLRDMEAARRIQASIIDRDFGHAEDWLSITRRYLPAEQVGGDFFDVFSLNDDLAVFYMADVAGHGVLAAMVTAFAIQALPPLVEKVMAQMPEDIPNPRKILKKLNRKVMTQGFENNGIPLYLTIFLGIIQRRTGTIHYSNGGHVPMPRLFGVDGTLRTLYLRGNPIGLVDRPKFEEASVRIGPGDQLVLGTDGLLEAMNDNRLAFNTDRLDAYLKESKGAKADSLADGILHMVKEFSSGKPQTDDISVMILAMDPEGGLRKRGAGNKAKAPIWHQIRDDGISAEFGATLEAVDVMDRITMDFMVSRNLDVDPFSVRLIVRESLLNAVRHGGGLDPGKIIKYEFQVRPWNLDIRVEDPGEGFQWIQALEREPERNAVSGRGLTILRAYADEVHFNPSGNVITVIIKRGGTTK